MLQNKAQFPYAGLCYVFQGMCFTISCKQAVMPRRQPITAGTPTPFSSPSPLG